MGSLLAEIVYGIERPRVSLLNIGAEPAKGRDVERSAFSMLEEAPVNFVGNLEGADIVSEVADVFVTDGFTGNVALKTIEAAAGLVASLIDRSFENLPGEVLPHITTPMSEIREIIDPARYGGAHLVGTSASVVICHGSSSRLSIFNAIRLASEGVKGGLIESLEHGLIRS